MRVTGSSLQAAGAAADRGAARSERVVGSARQGLHPGRGQEAAAARLRQPRFHAPPQQRRRHRFPSCPRARVCCSGMRTDKETRGRCGQANSHKMQKLVCFAQAQTLSRMLSIPICRQLCIAHSHHFTARLCPCTFAGTGRAMPTPHSM